MNHSHFSPDAYFDRLGIQALSSNALEVLQQLHALHPRHIAFENLNAWLGIPVSLDEVATHEKLVLQGRGGYCYEHNLLFMQVLKTLGFTVTGLAARVLWNQPPDKVLPRTHMLLLVTVDGERHIADVGFGGLTLTAALRLDTDAVQSTSHEEFRVSRDGANEHVLSSRIAGAWQPLYRFTLEEQKPADYVMANWFVSTHPQSRFVSELIAGRVDVGTRHVLLNNRYTRHHTNMASEVTQLRSPAEVCEVLERQLHINTGNLPGLDARLERMFQEAERR